MTVDKELLSVVSFVLVGIASLISFAVIVSSCLNQFGG